FDPARSGDLSCFVIVAPPMFAVEKFRVLKVIYWKGMNFRYQAKQIEQLFKKYNFTYLGVDVTGIGQGVFDNIQHFAMRVAVAIRYDLNTKNQLVLKAADVVESQAARQIIRHNHVFTGVDDTAMLTVKVNQLCQCQPVNWLGKMIGGIVVPDIPVVGAGGQNRFRFAERN
ncbi:hypothetical protein ACSRCY_22075, partial [Salmonella enterica]